VNTHIYSLKHVNEVYMEGLPKRVRVFGVQHAEVRCKYIYTPPGVNMEHDRTCMVKHTLSQHITRGYPCFRCAQTCLVHARTHPFVVFGNISTNFQSTAETAQRALCTSALGGIYTVVHILVGCGDPSHSRCAGVEMKRQSPSECHISRCPHRES
jgi:hypothetical protein